MRKEYTAAFKLKVALALHKGDKTVSQLCQDYEVVSSQIYKWKKQLNGSAEAIYGTGPHPSKTSKDSTALYAKIGELTVERDFLKKCSGL
jgi:transposase-like protein